MNIYTARSNLHRRNCDRVGGTRRGGSRRGSSGILPASASGRGIERRRRRRRMMRTQDDGDDEDEMEESLVMQPDPSTRPAEPALVEGCSMPRQDPGPTPPEAGGSSPIETACS